MTARDREIVKYIREVRDAQKNAPVMRWGTVATISPLTVFLDGSIDTAGNPVAAPARSAVGTVQVGARVYCVEQHRRVTITATPTEDTGWVNLDSYVLSSFDGTVWGRAVGPHVELTGVVTPKTGSIPAGGTTTDVLSALAPEFRPGGYQSRYGSAWRAGYTGSVVVRTSGTVGIAQRTVEWFGADFSITYLRG